MDSKTETELKKEDREFLEKNTLHVLQYRFNEWGLGINLIEAWYKGRVSPARKRKKRSTPFAWKGVDEGILQLPLQLNPKLKKTSGFQTNRRTALATSTWTYLLQMLEKITINNSFK